MQGFWAPRTLKIELSPARDAHFHEIDFFVSDAMTGSAFYACTVALIPCLSFASCKGGGLEGGNGRDWPIADSLLRAFLVTFSLPFLVLFFESFFT